MKKFLSVLTASAILLTTGSFALINNNNSKNNIILKQSTNIVSNTETKKDLSQLVTVKNIGDILKDSDQEIIAAINRKNKDASLNISELKIEKIDNKKAKISAKDDSKNYQGSVDVGFVVNKEAKFDLKDLIKVNEKIKLKLKSKIDITKIDSLLLKQISRANVKTTSELDIQQLDVSEILFNNPKERKFEAISAKIKAKTDSKNYKDEIEVKFTIEYQKEEKVDNKGVIIALSIASASVLAGTAILVTKKYKKSSTN
ncbi:Hypothetical protein, predicted transmembrane protein [Mycoplasma yeatsii 13926]|uniref:Transmembrane protein n=1 Tax=Mycoplasma yeatsii 13926 TaxID=1188240 RepID=S6G876_9MOLU|nr:hypothetical protein [Mycoplasma yeatsii]EOA06925.1 Hypothetical protein, predicted transmembrane protein [Mycoplasma yeatsii 13926]